MSIDIETVQKMTRPYQGVDDMPNYGDGRGCPLSWGIG